MPQALGLAGCESAGPSLPAAAVERWEAYGTEKKKSSLLLFISKSARRSSVSLCKHLISGMYLFITSKYTLKMASWVPY